MTYTSKQVAQICGVSVRTLQYYDQVGLLCPARDETNGYRRYTDADLSHLHLILLMKEVGMSLEVIRKRLLSPHLDPRTVLEEATPPLRREHARIDRLLKNIQRYTAMSDSTQDNTQTHRDAGYDDGTATAYATEAYARWGATDAYKQSMVRTKAYTQADWERIKKQQHDITHTIAEHMEEGSGSIAVQDAIALYFDFMQQFYDCSPHMFAGLGEMYVNDLRFTKRYNDIRPGLAVFMRDAMQVFAQGYDAHRGTRAYSSPDS